MKRVLSNILCHLDLKVKVKHRIMYFVVNASPPQRLDVGTSNLVGE